MSVCGWLGALENEERKRRHGRPPMIDPSTSNNNKQNKNNGHNKACLNHQTQTYARTLFTNVVGLAQVADRSAAMMQATAPATPGVAMEVPVWVVLGWVVGGGGGWLGGLWGVVGFIIIYMHLENARTGHGLVQRVARVRGRVDAILRGNVWVFGVRTGL